MDVARGIQQTRLVASKHLLCLFLSNKSHFYLIIIFKELASNSLLQNSRHCPFIKSHVSIMLLFSTFFLMD